ncbi:hypothetical protein D3C72_1631500 [compost metagenome]
MAVAGRRHLNAVGGHVCGAEAGLDVGFKQGGQLRRYAAQLHVVIGRHAALPAMGDKVVGHRADGVGLAGEQVDLAVAIEIDGEIGPAGGHELRHAHSACVAAYGVERVGVVQIGRRQKLLQFAAKVLGAVCCARVACRVVECQGG